MTSRMAAKFLKVEEFFEGYQGWGKVTTLNSCVLDGARKALKLVLNHDNGTTSNALLQFVQRDTLRVRWNPVEGPHVYSANNTRCVVMDTMEELQAVLAESEPVEVQPVGGAAGGRVGAQSRGPDGVIYMKVLIERDPFQITVYACDTGTDVKVWRTAVPGLYFTPHGADDHCIVQAVCKPATARYIGFGEQGGKTLCKNTGRVTFFNYDNMRYRQVYNRGPLDGREPLYHSDPFFMEFNGNPDRDDLYGLFVDNPSQTLMDIGYLNTGRYLLGTSFGDLDYYLILGHSAKEVLNDFTAIVGRPRLHPRYALGFHQGCYGYEKSSDLDWVVGQYRKYQYPLDGLHIDVDIQNNYQTFTVNENEGHFPNPQQMFARLRAQGVKCSTNITPIISNRDPSFATYTDGKNKGYFIEDKRVDPTDPGAKSNQYYEGGVEKSEPFDDREHNFNSGNPYIGEVYYGDTRGTTGHYPDLGRKEVRRWWGAQYQHLFDLGLEMVWQDMTTPAIRNTRGDMKGFPFWLLVTNDLASNLPAKQSPALKVWNLFSYNLHKATYHGLNRLKGRENKRNLIVGRGSFTGMHRFAALWTGDNASTWDFLKINVSQVISLGMCGLSICGEDIGGFESAEDWQRWADPELLMRWTAAGAFLPWFRNHYIRKGRKDFQEPFQYQTVAVNTVNPPESRPFYGMVLPVCKHYTELRYRLMQLFYDAMFENTQTGYPICRPMFLNDPGDKALYSDKLETLNDQFFVGPDLLVAPILDPQGPLNDYGKREVYLPFGSDWYNFMDNRKPLGPKVEGGTTVHDFDARLDANSDHIGFIVPLYVRAGAVLPTIELEQYVGERNDKGLPNPVTLNIYPGAKGSYTMYLDDGVSRSSAPRKPEDRGGDPDAKDQYRQTLVTHGYSNPNVRQVRVQRVHDGYKPKLETYFFVAILHDPSETRGPDGPLDKVLVAGQEIGPIRGASPEDRAGKLNDSPGNAFYYDENVNITFFKVIDNSSDILLELHYRGHAAGYGYHPPEP